ncbi:hypothetical protein, partial [Streptomyces eurythermus]|uniref:hypothetical protein n=1 Tax=Streptomyces eurythermus TaxID=42237 RepID=UPI0033E2FDC0
TDTVQKAQEERRYRQLEKALAKIVGRKNFSAGAVVDMSCGELFRALKADTQVDMQLYASELATDYMEAYYKVTLPSLVDSLILTPASSPAKTLWITLVSWLWRFARSASSRPYSLLRPCWTSMTLMS